MPTYPNQIVSGMQDEGTFLPFELFAGETDIVTDTAVPAGDIVQFTPITRLPDGRVEGWTGSAGRAYVIGTFSAVGTAGDTITINGEAITLRATAIGTHDVVIGASATATAAAVVAKLNAFQDVFAVTAEPAGASIVLTALEPGLAGNAITVSESSTAFSWAASATALAGGADTMTAKPMGIAAQPMTDGQPGPIYLAGFFNTEAIVWPPAYATLSLAEKKTVFDGTGIHIGIPKGGPGRMILPG